MVITNNMVLFFGKDDFLSNFFMRPFYHKDQYFQCAEQAFMYEKAVFFGDHIRAERILELPINTSNLPLVAKRLGRSVSPYKDELWTPVRDDVMYDVELSKYTDSVDLGDALLGTGDKILVEASPWDRYWGIGFSEHESNAHEPTKWTGQNKLGRVLMQVREDLRKMRETYDYVR